MKSNFPAEYVVEKDRRKLHLCAKHAEREVALLGAVKTAFPKGSDISCSECSADFVNR